MRSRKSDAKDARSQELYDVPLRRSARYRPPPGACPVADARRGKMGKPPGRDEPGYELYTGSSAIRRPPDSHKVASMPARGITSALSPSSFSGTCTPAPAGMRLVEA